MSRSFESRLPNAEGMGAFDMGDALHLALRASPTWVIVGEVRGAYVIHLLEAATSGIASVMCTIHSPSADGVFDKVLINALKASPPPATELVMRSLAALDLVVHVEAGQRLQPLRLRGLRAWPGGRFRSPDDEPDLPGPGPRIGAACRPDPAQVSERLMSRLSSAGLDRGWLAPETSDWRTWPPSADRDRDQQGFVSAALLAMTVAGLLIAGGGVGLVAALRGTSFLPPDADADGPTARASSRFRLGWRHLWAVGAGVACYWSPDGPSPRSGPRRQCCSSRASWVEAGRRGRRSPS